ncbi:MAG TPA: 50S ribosomal protein L11 methyltransferase [Saprospiraceae bacterium]|nr:50S ribosomal protein L11 methyltransferase [Saprospiraceae bacterium]
MMAKLFALGFDSFYEEDDCLHGYIDERLVTSELAYKIKMICDAEKITYTQSELKNENWNAVWEASFKPVILNDFCSIIAGFHPPEQNTRFTIRIDPKMAFGTGHHETTYMMIQEMEGLDFHGKKILDLGCGTGVLAILSEKMGASHVKAIDNDPLAFENTMENIITNQCKNIEVGCGSIENIGKEEYDIVLANINRNVLVDNAAGIMEVLVKGGVLLLSGVLRSDIHAITSVYNDFHGIKLKTICKGEWVCIQFKKSITKTRPSHFGF